MYELRPGSGAGPPAIPTGRPGDVEAMTTREGEALFWLPGHSALVAGDVLLGRADGGVRVCPDSWLGEKLTPERVRDELRGLLDRPVELILLAHGEPVLENAARRSTAR